MWICGWSTAYMYRVSVRSANYQNCQKFVMQKLFHSQIHSPNCTRLLRSYTKFTKDLSTISKCFSISQVQPQLSYHLQCVRFHHCHCCDVTEIFKMNGAKEPILHDLSVPSYEDRKVIPPEWGFSWLHGPPSLYLPFLSLNKKVTFTEAWRWRKSVRLIYCILLSNYAYK